MSEERSPGMAGRDHAPSVTRTAGLTDVARGLDHSAVPTMIIGALLAVLAPLAGFLGGTVVAPPNSADTSAVEPLYLWLFAGLVIGGVGALVAFLGGLRWVRANRNRW